MTIESWDDIRVALAVARTGTVSGAAADLGVHHATVIRRIDALEAALQARLFQRHPRGYALTEAGRTLLATADVTDQRFAQMAAQIAGSAQRIEGELIVTVLPEMASMVIPRLADLTTRHPDLRLTYLTDARLFRLATGEAHVAIRAGSKPTQPDYVVVPMGRIHHALFATQGYLDRHGPLTQLRDHRFALPGPEARNAPLMRWLEARLEPRNILLTANDPMAREMVIRQGLAIGPLAPDRAEGLVEAMSLPEWDSTLWIVSHVDLHRTPKVQAALTVLRRPA
ncbi:MAG: LysR family transcriptional regulator [Paracoccus sp. (in: a-proteobacteria)]|uniref:LysR family transcriptional regulator n=1 Tax=Paracoccus TaxID=265 RepID=UPI000DBA5A69|nr:LysR family transcriptional regulator [Paracoccus sediminilitoris]